MSSWYLPLGYEDRLEPDYSDDRVHTGIVHQPEVYDVVEYLAVATGRSTVIDVGCGAGRKLMAIDRPHRIGIDYGANLALGRAAFPDGEWHEADLASTKALRLADLGSPDAVVVCADVVEHLPDPTILLRLLAEFYRRGAIVITSSPDRIRVNGATHLGPPPNRAHVREWALPEYEAVLAERGLGLTYAGYTVNNTEARALRTMITISDPTITSPATTGERQRPLAILAGADDIGRTSDPIGDWLSQGCDVHLVIGGSRTEIATATIWAARAPGRFTFEIAESARHAERVEQVALAHEGRWIATAPTDISARAPFRAASVATALELVSAWGANRVRFTDLEIADRDGAVVGQFANDEGSFASAWLQGAARSVEFPYRFLAVRDLRGKPGALPWPEEEELWADHGLLVMTDLVERRTRRGWSTAIP